MDTMENSSIAGSSVSDIKNSVSCFTCDQEIVGAKISLVNSVTAHSNTGIAVKISELIGDDFVVVISQEDFICKRCNVLFNLMDRLQSELNSVQNALSGYIKNKYNLAGITSTVPETTSNEIPTVMNGVQSSETQQSLPTLATPAPPQNTPSEDTGTKTTKIYKCGFCDFQSKELDVVRFHTRIHLKTDQKRGEKRIATPVPPKPIKRKLFRCQVCSASYFDRKSCLNHIKSSHTAVDSQATLPTSQPDNIQLSNNTVGLKNNTTSDQVNTISNEVSAISDQVNSISNQVSAINNQVNSTDNSSVETKESDDKPSSYSQNETLLQNDEPALENDKTEEPRFSVKLEDGSTVDQPTNDSETNSKTLGIDIEAMLAALHSDTNNSNCDAIPEQMES